MVGFCFRNYSNKKALKPLSFKALSGEAGI